MKIVYPINVSWTWSSWSFWRHFQATRRPASPNPRQPDVFSWVREEQRGLLLLLNCCCSSANLEPRIFKRLLIRKPGSSTPTSLSSPDRSIESRIGTWSTAEPIKTFVGHLLQVFTFHSYLATSVSALATGDPRQSKPERDRVRQIKTK